MVLQSLLELKRLVGQLSYQEGEFTLSSGQKSSFYIDLKNTTLHPDGAYWIGEAVCDVLLSQAQPLKIDAVGGLTLGADPLATAVSLAARKRGIQWPAFIVRKEPKAHGTSRWIEGTHNLSPGASVLILEDVVTTGGSSLKAIECLRSAGFCPLATLTIVDRESGGSELMTRSGLRFYALMTLKEIQNDLTAKKCNH